ncbi:MAG: hypothetical protein JJ953_01015 [Gracilimonas sp.]|uniref:hypothetical protein n=1 Tax=Gracilimonas TaxID=649462 RepID=UPI001B249D70|nr:hypothetical protein [Gracilimonas sp.]MBO6584662.1 hypothetical protein [Gracilimonas sp.]MBO6616067.1 hypothetical protein [Gracilimonas sp.]
MKKLTFIPVPIVAFLLMIGLIACETNSTSTLTNNHEFSGGMNVPELSALETNTEPSSAEFTLEASYSASDIDLNADNINTSEHLLFDVYSSNQLSVTGNLSITTGTESTIDDPFKINPVIQTYKNMPSSIRYDGYSSLQYTLNGSNYSTALSADEKNILFEIQQELDILQSYGSGEDRPGQLLKSSNNSNTPENEKPLEAMDDGEIKKWLKDKGYKVKELGNRRFEVIYKYKEDTPSKMMSIASIFDANTGRMEPNFTASKDGKEIARNAAKKDGNSKAVKMKRGDEGYLLLQTTPKKQHN